MEYHEFLDTLQLPEGWRVENCNVGEQMQMQRKLFNDDFAVCMFCLVICSSTCEREPGHETTCAPTSCSMGCTIRWASFFGQGILRCDTQGNTGTVSDSFLSPVSRSDVGCTHSRRRKQDVHFCLIDASSHRYAAEVRTAHKSSAHQTHSVPPVRSGRRG